MRISLYRLSPSGKVHTVVNTLSIDAMMRWIKRTPRLKRDGRYWIESESEPARSMKKMRMWGRNRWK